ALSYRTLERAVLVVRSTAMLSRCFSRVERDIAPTMAITAIRTSRMPKPANMRLPTVRRCRNAFITDLGGAFLGGGPTGVLCTSAARNHGRRAIAHRSGRGDSPGHGRRYRPLDDRVEAIRRSPGMFVPIGKLGFRYQSVFHASDGNPETPRAAPPRGAEASGVLVSGDLPVMRISEAACCL